MVQVAMTLELMRRSFEFVSMHSFRHVARKSTWSCISSSTVRLMPVPTLNRNNDQQIYQNCE